MNEIDLLLEEFEQNPKDPKVQQKVLDLVKTQVDASELILRIIRRCTSKLSESGSHYVAAVALDFSTGELDSISKQLDESPGLMGKLHSEHLYFVAKCIGCSPAIDEKLLNEVISRLLSEFDLEVVFPRAAIIAFGDIGEKAIPVLMQYLSDGTKETFSREDVALALGMIGTDLVVKELTICLDKADDDDKAMSLYALGKTRNTNARQPILMFLNAYPDHPKTWVARNALAEIPFS